MGQFFTVLNQISVFLIFILLGILAMKFDILDSHSLGYVSKVVMKLALPAFFLVNTVEGTTRVGLTQSLKIIPLTVVLWLLLLGASRLLERLFRMEGDRRNILRGMVLFGNVGFMGTPLLVELYPNSAMLYLSLFTLLDQLLFWTYGVSLTRPAAKRQRFSPKQLKSLLSPALVAIALGALLVLLEIPLPKLLSTALSKLGAASMPMSQLYIGGLLSTVDLRKILRCGEVYGLMLLKMLLLPILFYIGMHLCGITGDMAGTMAFLMGLPSINLVAMLAKSNGSDGEYAVSVVMLTTLCSLATLPLISLAISLIR